jgi:UTP--glucose-1-phosphate uridylyltransferase
MLPATRAVPKELLPLGVTPVIDLVLAELTGAGLEDIVVVGAPDKPALAAHLEGVPGVRVVEQPRPRGLGDAVRCAAAAVGDAPFVVALPDALVGHDVVPALLGLVAGGFDGAIALEPVPAERALRYGIAELAADGTLTRLREKPEAVPPGRALAVAARYVLPPTVFATLAGTPPGRGGEVQLTDAIASLVAGGARLAGHVIAGRRDVGSPAGYAEAFRAEAHARGLG